MLGIDSGEETDVEGEKRKEVHAWELHRHAREKERERRRAEEEEAKRLARERERQHQTAAEAQDREPSKDAASQKKRGTHPRQLGSRRSLRLQAVHSDTVRNVLYQTPLYCTAYTCIYTTLCVCARVCVCDCVTVTV